MAIHVATKKYICQRLLAGLVLSRLCPCDGLRLNGPVDRPPCEPWACGLLAQQPGDQDISPTCLSCTEIYFPNSLARRPWRRGPVGGRAAGPGGWAGGRRGPIVGRFCRWLRNSLGHLVSLSFFRSRFPYGRFFVQLFFRIAVFFVYRVRSRSF